MRGFTAEEELSQAGLGPHSQPSGGARRVIGDFARSEGSDVGESSRARAQTRVVRRPRPSGEGLKVVSFLSL